MGKFVCTVWEWKSDKDRRTQTGVRVLNGSAEFEVGQSRWSSEVITLASINHSFCLGSSHPLS